MRFLAGLLALHLIFLAWWRPALWQVAVFVPLGIVQWMIQEYLIHRFILHARPKLLTAKARAWFDRLHPRHHRDVLDPEGLYFGESFFIVMMTEALVEGWLVGGPGTGALMSLGMGLSILQYGLMHLAAHSTYQPRTWFWRMMKRSHMAHHYQDARRRHGLLCPFGDMLGGTWSLSSATTSRESAARSST